MKRALVLAGGGTRGIYQIGALKALHELEQDQFDMIFGVSVGALNAALLVQGDLDRLIYMYEHLESSQIVKGFVPNDMSIGNLINERQEFIPAFKYYMANHSFDFTPFYDLCDQYFDYDKFMASPIEFYCVTATAKNHDGILVDKKMIEKDGQNWIIASASAYPAFPMMNINGEDYVDGGYFDNFPIDFALQKGAEEIVGIDLGSQPLHPLYLEKDHIRYVHPREELFNFLTFDKEKMQHARVLGYNDTMKTYGRFEGFKYTFYPFSLPSYFDEYYRGLLMLETKIYLATSLNERFRSQQVITNLLKEQMHVDHLNTRQYLYGILDALLDLCNVSSEKVYTLEEAKKIILATFAKCAYEGYAIKPNGITDIVSYCKTLDRKGIVEKMVHANLYPKDRFINEDAMMTLYPFEVALADFVTIMMKHLVEER